VHHLAIFHQYFGITSAIRFRNASDALPPPPTMSSQDDFPAKKATYEVSLELPSLTYQTGLRDRRASSFLANDPRRAESALSSFRASHANNAGNLSDVTFEEDLPSLPQPSFVLPPPMLWVCSLGANGLPSILGFASDQLQTLTAFTTCSGFSPALLLHGHPIGLSSQLASSFPTIVSLPRTRPDLELGCKRRGWKGYRVAS
jgi:hypothetical protein